MAEVSLALPEEMERMLGSGQAGAKAGGTFRRAGGGSSRIAPYLSTPLATASA